jgi:hypothetical protein
LGVAVRPQDSMPNLLFSCSATIKAVNKVRQY